MGVELYYLLGFLILVIIGIGVAVRRNRTALPPPRGVEPLPEPKPVKALPEPEPEPEPEAEEEAPEEEPKKKKDVAALKQGLSKTRGGFVAKIAGLFGGRKQIDPATMDQLEEVLLTADIGVKTSQKIFESLRKELSRDQLTDPEAIWRHIRAQSAKVLDVGAPPLDLGRANPLVILVIGVNGVGKTTTIGKLAQKYSKAGKKVILAAGDTFRAAATEQLVIWGDRTGSPVVRGKEGGDPSSVVFEAVKRAQAEGFDLVLADTAGRLHTKTDLMEELQKVKRVTAKAQDGAPHEVFLVLDSTTGQNAIAQAKLFQEAMAISGIILTKLDGTAKGAVILGICDELKVPVRYIGIGEKVDDLREFDAEDFVQALYEDADEPPGRDAA
jgi:fused signal recognition particle receptor